MTNLRAEREAAIFDTSQRFSSENRMKGLLNGLYYVNQRNRLNCKRANNVMWSLYDSLGFESAFDGRNTWKVGCTVSCVLFHPNYQLKVIVIPTDRNKRRLRKWKRIFISQPGTACAFRDFLERPAASLVETAINISTLNWSHWCRRHGREISKKVGLCNSANAKFLVIFKPAKMEDRQLCEETWVSSVIQKKATRLRNSFLTSERWKKIKISEISFYWRRKCEGKDVKEK